MSNSKTKSEIMIEESRLKFLKEDMDDAITRYWDGVQEYLSNSRDTLNEKDHKELVEGFLTYKFGNHRIEFWENYDDDCWWENLSRIKFIICGHFKREEKKLESSFKQCLTDTFGEITRKNCEWYVWER